MPESCLSPGGSAKVLLLVLLLVLLGGSLVASFTPSLHELLTPEELERLFGQSLAEDLPDYQVVLLPAAHPAPVELEDVEAVEAGDKAEGAAFPYEFHAFGRPVGLTLRRNRHLVAPSFKVVVRGGALDFDPEEAEALQAAPRCHFLHRDEPGLGPDPGSMVAALSLCRPGKVHGLVLRGNESLEIWPLPERLHAHLAEAVAEDDGNGLADGGGGGARVPHLIKRLPLDQHHHLFSDGDAGLCAALPRRLVGTEGHWLGDNFLRNAPISHLRLRRGGSGGDGLEHKEVEAVLSARNRFQQQQQVRGGAQARLVLETALFLDEAAYRLFAPFVSNDERQLRDMILAYLNGVQALYHHPSLGRPVDITLVRLELFRAQPRDLPHHEGDRGPLLDSFCAYNERHNPPGDEDPHHWDMGLYVSGLDFFAYENGRKSGVTMGLATVGGVCLDRYACVIAELGTVNVFGKPYPSAGFTSVYILAHEIGHNLGMHHDSTSNSCPKDGFIMSPSRGTQGEAVWSTCSMEVLQKATADCLMDRPRAPPKDMDHMAMYKDEPGQAWSAKK
ncbi:A disintegrin and metalloproteinase with thrombospondin motifs adt-1, partial [Frankliniella fusca]